MKPTIRVLTQQTYLVPPMIARSHKGYGLSQWQAIKHYLAHSGLNELFHSEVPVTLQLLAMSQIIHSFAFLTQVQTTWRALSGPRRSNKFNERGQEVIQQTLVDLLGRKKCFTMLWQRLTFLIAPRIIQMTKKTI